MITVDVDLGDRAYPVHIGSRLLSKAELFAPHIRGTCAVIIANKTVASLYTTEVEAAIRSPGRAVDTAILSDGESFEKWDALNRIPDALLTADADHKTTLIALSGGVVGDMTGFVATCYMRGVPFIQVPTTLLSQVDSSVDSKIGINHPLGKDMIGTFHQPQAVLADVGTLCVLPVRELTAGMAEVVKHGTVVNAGHFTWIEQNIKGLSDYDIDLVAEAMHGSVCIKAAIVAQDERETGLHTTLNFGHTFGHVTEADLGYGEWLHGEAVSYGMMMAADLSRRLGFIGIDTRNRIAALTRAANLPTVAPDLGAGRFTDLIRVDKKAEADEIKFVLLHKLGRAFMTAMPGADLRATLQHAVL